MHNWVTALAISLEGSVPPRAAASIARKWICVVAAAAGWKVRDGQEMKKIPSSSQIWNIFSPFPPHYLSDGIIFQ
jgi:hypothetical protein